MATIGRGDSKSVTDMGGGTGIKAAESDAAKIAKGVDDPIVERGNPKQADPVTETGDPKRADPVPEAKSPDRLQGDEVVGTADPNKALAASETDLAKLQAARRARLIKAGILTAIALILIAFVLQNAQPVAVKLLGWTVSIRLIWVIVASALLGAVAGYLVGRPDKQILLHGPSRREEDH